MTAALQSKSLISRLTLEDPSTLSQIGQLSESHYILAKYRIQVIDPEPFYFEVDVEEVSREDIKSTSHYHAGPEAIGRLN